MTLKRPLIIATRESALALWQAHHVRDRLMALHPGLQVELLGMTTQGDRILDVTLNKIGGKGLFVKELEQALLEGRADLAVHSLKDVPMTLPEGFSLAAIGEREDPRDAFVSNKFRQLSDLPPAAVVGTSSLRRESQLRARYPHLDVQPLRGNVNTRLRKLDEGLYDAIILAAAGLKRLGYTDRIASLLEPEQSLPAAGQGALGIEIRSDRVDLLPLLAPLHHRDTASCVRAEREVSRQLGGSCQVPLGVYATLNSNLLYLRGFVSHPHGEPFIHSQVTGTPDNPENLGQQLAQALRSQGAEHIIASLG
ncbi:MAG: hydroxymethylbilane synthase [Hydrogenophilaceae bacterium]|nr:hydroxymethylbilane synthase [Hydrogenophilaceae bacterium]